ncbi:MAG: MBL fold metallo-hydrolase [Bacteroidales bacterium]|nr:MBL fold metallo-hydrolase [Bacteroidales bacterium]
MRVTFLGTGTSQGVPVIACHCEVCSSTDPHDKHLRCSSLVETDGGKNILIDIGPDFREQMLRHKVEHLDSILITHAHRDHVGGIDDIRSFNYVQNKPMDIYGNADALSTIRNDYHYIFEHHEFAGLPEANMHEIDGSTPFQAADMEVVPVKAFHKTLPVLGFRLDRFGYLTDCNHIEPQELDKLRGVEVLAIGALRKEKHFSHFCLSEALQVVEVLQPRLAYIIHVSHQMGLYAQVEAELPDHVHVAYDGLQVNL